MKKALFISFDIVRQGETEKSLSIATMMANIKNDADLKNKILLDHIGINMLPLGSSVSVNNYELFIAGKEVYDYDFILLSAYIWNEYFINAFIAFLRKQGFAGKIVLGGYQITYANKEELSVKYPDAQVFILGYAEQALKKLFGELSSDSSPVFLNEVVDFDNIISPYLSNELQVETNIKMLRWETKRGCPFKCSFCAHRDLTNKKVYNFKLDKSLKEIAFFNETQVKRINILDPVFNIGDEYLEIMKEIVRTNTTTQFTLQTRFESIKKEKGNTFLDLCTKGNFHLEFGLQTLNDIESKSIDRNNNYTQINEMLVEVIERNISFEISLIYGLPGQTLDSFSYGIDKLHKMGCKSIKAYPLMLLPGTKLFVEKKQWGMEEEVLGEYNIPLVTSSNSFSKKEWEIMHQSANELMETSRI